MLFDVNPTPIQSINSQSTQEGTMKRGVYGSKVHWAQVKSKKEDEDKPEQAHEESTC